MKTLEEQERLLMEEWKIRWKAQHGEYEHFNGDGIVDYDRWNQIPAGKHILVVLKETNGLTTDLTSFLGHGGNGTYHRTWNNVARWVHMILNDQYLDRIPREVLDDTVKNIAAINIKKYPGGPRANNQTVRDEAMKDRDLIKRQIALYAPDIILTGGWGLLSDFLRDQVLQDSAPWYDPRKRENLEEEPNLWYFWTTKAREGKPTLLISMPHPNRAGKKWTWELKKVLEREAVGLESLGR